MSQDMERWRRKIVQEQRQAERFERRYEALGGQPVACWMCGEDHPRRIQWDHFFGRANSPIEKPLCLNHHATVSERLEDHKDLLAHRDKPANELLEAMLMNLAYRIAEFADFVVEFLKQLAHYCREHLQGHELPAPPLGVNPKMPAQGA